MSPQEYLLDIKSHLIASVIVKTFDVVESYALVDRGYFKARLTLTNTDFVQVSEYFVVEQQEIATVRYRYQWMDSTKQKLKKRWDNAPHFPSVPNFPHHIHIGSEDNVEPGQMLSIIDLIEHLEQILTKN